MGGRPRFGWVRRGELRGIEANSAVWWLGWAGGWDLDGSGGEGGVSIFGSPRNIRRYVVPRCLRTIIKLQGLFSDWP